MQNLIISFNAIAPMFAIMAVGAVCRRVNVIGTDAAFSMSNVAFRVFMPTLMFYNIYRSGSGSAAASSGLLPFFFISVAVMYAAVFFTVKAFVKDNRQRGAMIHAIYRSNFVLLGLPIALSLFPPEQTGVVSMVAALLVPMFNVLAVYTLETFRGGKPSVKKTALGIAKNPLIIGTVLGIIFWRTGIVLPSFAESAVSSLSSAATPVALFALGASFNFSSLRKNAKYIAAGTLSRLVLVPGVLIPAGVLLGFRGVELSAIMAAFASPAAVSTFTMAQQMESDEMLAAGLVLATSACSCVTIFLWTFSLKQLGFM